jgi:hypothetical protein
MLMSDAAAANFDKTPFRGRNPFQIFLWEEEEKEEEEEEGAAAGMVLPVIKLLPLARSLFLFPKELARERHVTEKWTV